MTGEGDKNKKKVCLVGSGNWGSAIAKIVGGNVTKEAGLFDERVRMWVHEETLGDGRKLSEVINKEHENVKYLPNIKLPENVVAVTDLREAARDAEVLIFVVPNQFLLKTCQTLSGHISSKAIAISLIKGVEVNERDGECPITLVSDIIQQQLHIDVSVLMGANIAEGVALEQFCETTVGFRNRENGELFKKLFHTPHFRVTLIDDVVGVELCGALKNVVALAAGFIDALRFGDNTKAAIIRLGLLEMKKFCQLFFDGDNGEKMSQGSIKEQTFLESCGIADLITSCYGGRNRKVAEQFAITRKSWEELEKEMLNGQHLQGTLMAKAVETILEHHRRIDEFPLFRTIIRICFHGLDPSRIVEDI